ncbi:MAG TPA: DUF4043 family protein [Roseateles sp.]|uniref:phage capsid family protein n=1 Tax=Roseateles sp. TaxID=1971397 RepID=UPI002ED9F088
MTTISKDSAIAVKKESVALAALGLRKPTNLTKLVGQAPQQAGAEATLKQQSNPGMPGIMVRDLAQGAGDKVTIDAVDILTGKPIMGDRMREGKGVPIGLSSMEARIDNASMVVYPGAKMTQKRTAHRLRSVAMAQLMGYFPRLLWQRALTHIAGARGSQNTVDWHVPTADDPDFSEIMINPVLAPSYNRHLVIDGNELIQGGQQLANIDSTDGWKLGHIDALAEYLDSITFKVQPIKLPGDPAADDEPIKGVLYLDPQGWNQLLKDQTAGHNIRTWQVNALERAKLMGANIHPLFRGEMYMWNNILLKKMEHSIFFNPGDFTQIITNANRYTGASNSMPTETAQQVNAALTAGYRVTRSIFMGSQAFAQLIGANESSGVNAAFKERAFDYGEKYEAMGQWMGGETKLRFRFKDQNGQFEWTDHGAIVIDAAVKSIGN